MQQLIAVYIFGYVHKLSVIGLMFKYNVKWHKTCCKCFIVLYWMKYYNNNNTVGNDKILQNVIQMNVKDIATNG